MVPVIPDPKAKKHIAIELAIHEANYLVSTLTSKKQFEHYFTQG